MGSSGAKRPKKSVQRVFEDRAQVSEVVPMDAPGPEEDMVEDEDKHWGAGVANLDFRTEQDLPDDHEFWMAATPVPNLDSSMEQDMLWGNEDWAIGDPTT